MQPIILVTADRREPSGFIESPRIRPRRPEIFLTEAYIHAVRESGGIPLVVPSIDVDPKQLLALADGVLLTGGHFDIHPSHYGQQVDGRLDRVESSRTQLELELARLALSNDIPILGICGGMQAMAVADGGSLIQDIPPGPIPHEQPNDPAEGSHKVVIDGPATKWLPRELWVNSTHHQAVASCGQALTICGRSVDGIAEVIASPTHRFALGVQWHPELLGEMSCYKGLVHASTKR